MGWSEKDLCIKCDRGGKILACSESRTSRCPIVVHEKCMGFQAYFDDGGDFYCPYCLYRQTTAELHKALEVAMLKKQALSTFLDKEVLNGEKLLSQPSDVLQSINVHHSMDNNCDNDALLAVGHRTECGPVVADGCKSSDEQVAIQEGLRAVEDGEGMEAEHNSVVDDDKIDKHAEDPQEDDHPNEIPERERKAMKNDQQILAENDLGVEDIQDDGYLNETPERQKTTRRRANKLLAESEPDVDYEVLERDDENHQEDGRASQLQERGNKTKEKTKRDKKTRKNAKQVLTKNEQLQNSDVEDRPEDGHLCDIPDRENKVRRISKRMLAEDEPEVDEEQLAKDVDGGHPSEIPDSVKKTRRKSKRKLAEDEPEVVDKVLNKDVEDCHLREIPDKEEKMRRRSKRKLAEYVLEVDEQQIDKDIEGGHLSDTPVSEKDVRRKSKRRLAEDEPEIDDEQLDEECNLREITENEDNVKKKSLKMQTERKENEAGGAESGAVSTRSKCILKKSETEDEPLNSDPKKRSSGSTYATTKVSNLNGETNEPIKLLALEHSTWQRSPIPNGRRKKLMWSEEEEEMLKEGVHKFSTTANKNIPWRKILDFGRHVFDGTRTPVDLKDKWRTLWAK
ncbi:hypothetical protein DM860_014660 [Cuscuta australis]|uniref:Myb-like domain-containing protein n=1 Tax=Cuscuta australis TaxID=267555 RepID=A0A328DJ44_9ASTE|nr:hypothetical protein DM860_014660 [Cuscuta australis]